MKWSSRLLALSSLMLLVNSRSPVKIVDREVVAPSSLHPLSTPVSTEILSSSLLSVPSGTPYSVPLVLSQSVDPAALSDLETILPRRLSFITRATTGLSSIPAWVSTLGTNGAWPSTEVDYTTGCNAQRANWPAQAHWTRLLTLASAWHGGISTPGGNKYVGNATVLDAISRAMNYWFDNNYNVTECIDQGGTPQCPCGTLGFWNTNWFSNVILIPKLVGQVCLLVNSTLTPTQLSGCSLIMSRTYAQFFRPLADVPFLSGANVLDIGSISIDLGLLTTNLSVVQDGYLRIHNEVVIQLGVSADGIRPDGSFGQHIGVLYNGNYGKDYTNDVLALEITAGGTQFSATNISRNAVSTLFDGDQWMIYQNTLTSVLHWDFSALGRFISFPVADNQATSNIHLNLSDISVLGMLWNASALINFANSMNKNTSSANIGDLRGNRMFYNNDYMVHRGSRYVTTLKMYSNRTKNTECLNSQNPFGFHLSDGAVHTYLNGDEYEDIAASWDWDLIPGITVDYRATPLTCATAEAAGLHSFVGGVSDGQVGAAAMRYTNPLTNATSWQKAWFFLEHNVQIVVLSDLSSNSSNVVSVLDQRRKNGPYYINGIPQDDAYSTSIREVQCERRGQPHHHSVQNTHSKRFPFVESLWHGGVGYTFDIFSSPSLSVETGPKTGNWSLLGISTQPPTTVDLFTAWLDQPASNTFAYTVYPGTTYQGFRRKVADSGFQKQVIRNDKHVSAVLDKENNTVFIIFWDDQGGEVSIPSFLDRRREITICADANAAIIYKMHEGSFTVSDPSQTKTNLNIKLMEDGFGEKVKGFEHSSVISMHFQLPVNGTAGSSVTQTL